MQEYYENETKAVTTNCDQNHQIIDRPLSSLTSQFILAFMKTFSMFIFRSGWRPQCFKMLNNRPH